MNHRGERVENAPNEARFERMYHVGSICTRPYLEANCLYRASYSKSTASPRKDRE